jgi:hypothetical protein
VEDGHERSLVQPARVSRGLQTSGTLWRKSPCSARPRLPRLLANLIFHRRPGELCPTLKDHIDAAKCPKTKCRKTVADPSDTSYHSTLDP